MGRSEPGRTSSRFPRVVSGARQASGDAHGVRPFAVSLPPAGKAAFRLRRPRARLPFPHPGRRHRLDREVGRVPGSVRRAWVTCRPMTVGVGRGGRGSRASAPRASRTASVAFRPPVTAVAARRSRPRLPWVLVAPLSGLRAPIGCRPALRPGSLSTHPGVAAPPRPLSGAPDSRGPVVCAARRRHPWSGPGSPSGARPSRVPLVRRTGGLVDSSLSGLTGLRPPFAVRLYTRGRGEPVIRPFRDGGAFSSPHLWRPIRPWAFRPIALSASAEMPRRAHCCGHTVRQRPTGRPRPPACSGARCLAVPPGSPAGRASLSEVSAPSATRRPRPATLVARRPGYPAVLAESASHVNPAFASRLRRRPI